MTITEEQAEMILVAFSCVHDQGQMDNEDIIFCTEIMAAFPKLGKCIKRVEVTETGYSYLVTP